MFFLARSKLNNIESKISEALINSEIRDFVTIINDEKNYEYPNKWYWKNSSNWRR